MSDKGFSKWRQMDIFFRLYLAKQVNTKDLADEYGVSVRTIQKDMQTIREIHGEILFHDKKTGTYKIIKKERLKGIKEFEEDILIRFANILYSAIVENAEDYKENIIDIKLNCEKLPKDFFILIMSKIKFKFPINFLYTNRKGEKKRYDVYPYKVVLFDKYWYLLAKDIKDGKIKSFAVSKIKEIKHSTEQSFEEEKERKKAYNFLQTVNSPWFDEGNEKEAILEVKGEAREYLLRAKPLNIEIIEEKQDKIIIKLKYYVDKEVLIFTKRWLPDTKILSPERLNDKLKKTLSDYIKEKI